MQIIDGKAIATQIKAEIFDEVKTLIQAGNRPPKLAAVLVGSDGASQTYVANKERTCSQLGFASEIIRLPESVCQQEILDIVALLNDDAHTDGFIVQMPLPKQICAQEIIQSIAPNKDVDGFHPVNVGRMCAWLPCLLPATPLGITLLLRRSGINTAGKHCVILGRSGIVGRPLSIMLSQKEYNATVTLCHSSSLNVAQICRSADILIAAMGQPDFVTADMVKQNAVVIDVGTTRIDDANSKHGYMLKGDVKFSEVAPKCSYITPVPGGVGPMTIAALMLNTLNAYKSNL
jgi:methylenetetrahydrofolate dehydrogenase (NADP+)/methenyltetrahydrofolate cyclohydrolase